jgi:hypothetical protein
MEIPQAVCSCAQHFGSPPTLHRDPQRSSASTGVLGFQVLRSTQWLAGRCPRGGEGTAVTSGLVTSVAILPHGNRYPYFSSSFQSAGSGSSSWLDPKPYPYFQMQPCMIFWMYYLPGHRSAASWGANCCNETDHHCNRQHPTTCPHSSQPPVLRSAAEIPMSVHIQPRHCPIRYWFEPA